MYELGNSRMVSKDTVNRVLALDGLIEQSTPYSTCIVQQVGNVPHLQLAESKELDGIICQMNRRKSKLKMLE